MIRQSLDANSSSASAFMYAYGNPPVVEEFDYRKYSGGPTYSSSVGSSALGWVKLARSANTFSAFSSSDGISWTPIGTTQTIPSTQTVYAGILSTTGSGTALGTATIDNVSITLGSSLPNPFAVSIGCRNS